ncbi:hypothetical protein PG999_009522 [Apiospora kogelbergensis]|uniref:Uncharacterized protein n=1 Tax=Apiospora kogelbergensis TaxID=1337665 RepID=A0AAW0QTG1_9PEZI
MVDPSSDGAGTAGRKRTASDDLSNGDDKRARTEPERREIPVADLLNVDFCGLNKLCHLHERQVGDLGDPFDAVERWARRALPRDRWDSDVQVGHWMRSKSLGVAYIFQNGYCYDNGRQYITVPVYGGWVEYDRFKCFRADDGKLLKWYSILPVCRLQWDTGNRQYPNIHPGTWTVGRHGKPVVLGKDNRFYPSILDAFRERNPVSINDDGEIEVLRKHLGATSGLEGEPLSQLEGYMSRYGPYLRIAGGNMGDSGSHAVEASVTPETETKVDQDVPVPTAPLLLPLLKAPRLLPYQRETHKVPLKH